MDLPLPAELALPGVYLTGVRSSGMPSWTLPVAVVAAAAVFLHALEVYVAGDVPAAVVQGVAAGVWAQAAWEQWRKRPRRRRERSRSRVVDLGHRLATVRA